MRIGNDARSPFALACSRAKRGSFSNVYGGEAVQIIGTPMKTTGRLMAMLLVLCAALSFSALAADKDKQGDEPNQRSVQGVVTDASDAPVQGAVVQLKNTKTLQIRSFFTKEQGSYSFHGLSSDIEYELKAEHSGASSAVKKLSPFDNRKKAILNLKLDK